MTAKLPAHKQGHIVIGLNAVLATIGNDCPLVLCTNTERNSGGPVRGPLPNRSWGLPYGAFDPEAHRTFEIGLRKFVTAQTNIKLDYVEQLYTFGDKGRAAPRAALRDRAMGDRIISVGYLALAPEPMQIKRADTAWRDWYSHFPWEDWRCGEPAILHDTVLPTLKAWAEEASSRREHTSRLARIRLAFGSTTGWEENRALDRYELMYEAGLVAERHEQPRPDKNAAGGLAGVSSLPVSAPMISDHRRILATAIDRIRGKLKYRPIFFDLMPDSFTLLELQTRIEAILGYPLHKQNFRRTAEKSGLIEKTREIYTGTGRPAAMFRARKVNIPENSDQDYSSRGLALPRLRKSPSCEV